MSLEIKLDTISEEQAMKIVNKLVEAASKNRYDCSTCNQLIDYYLHEAMTKRKENAKEALESFVSNVDEVIIPTLEDIIQEIDLAVNEIACGAKKHKEKKSVRG